MKEHQIQELSRVAATIVRVATELEPREALAAGDLADVADHLRSVLTPNLGIARVRWVREHETGRRLFQELIATAMPCGHQVGDLITHGAGDVTKCGACLARAVVERDTKSLPSWSYHGTPDQSCDGPRWPPTLASLERIEQAVRESPAFQRTVEGVAGAVTRPEVMIYTEPGSGRLMSKGPDGVACEVWAPPRPPGAFGER